MPTQPDYSYFRVGACQQPLPSPGTNSLLQDADPALFFWLDYATFIINTYPGPRLLSAASAAGLGSGPNAITSAVAQAYPRHPRIEWLQNQLELPLLIVTRTRSQTGRLTAGWEHDRGWFDLLYVLPPLDAAQEELIGPILHAVEQALRNRVTQAWDPAYTPPGGNLGDPFDAAAYGGVEAIGFGDPYRDPADSATYGYLEGTGEIAFPCLKMQGYIIERDMPVTGIADVFTGGDITGNLQADDGTVVPASESGIVQASTQQAPTLMSLDPTSGTYEGGTSVTLTGTRFTEGPNGMAVFFGSVPATGLVYTSSTNITVTTPAMSGTGTVDVLVVNGDGQTAVLDDAFEFT